MPGDYRIRVGERTLLPVHGSVAVLLYLLHKGLRQVSYSDDFYSYVVRVRNVLKMYLGDELYLYRALESGKNTGSDGGFNIREFVELLTRISMY